MWTRAVDAEVGWETGQAWPVGQDAALAADLAGGTSRSAGSCRRSSAPIDAGLEAASGARPLAEDAPWPGSTAAGSRSSRGR